MIANSIDCNEGEEVSNVGCNCGDNYTVYDICRVQTADCRAQTADRRLQTADCRLQTADCRLQTADCMWQ